MTKSHTADRCLTAVRLNVPVKMLQFLMFEALLLILAASADIKREVIVVATCDRSLWTKNGRKLQPGCYLFFRKQQKRLI